MSFDEYIFSDHHIRLMSTRQIGISMNIIIRIFIIVIPAIIMSCASSGQKIGLKNDILYIDKKETPIKVYHEYKDPDDFYFFHQEYRFFDSSRSTPFLIVDYKGVQVPGRPENVVWLEISDAERTKTNSVDFKGGFISSKKHVIKDMINKYHFFNQSGVVDYSRISEFLASGVQADAKSRALNVLSMKKESYEKIKKIDPFVGSDLTVTKGGMLGESIGRIEVADNYNSTGIMGFSVYDLADNLIASAVLKANYPSVGVSLIDGRRFSYYTQHALSLNITGGGRMLMTELIEQIILKGYSLGYSYDENLVINESEVDIDP